MKKVVFKVLIIFMSLVITSFSIYGITTYEVAKSIPAAEGYSDELVMYDWDNYVKHHDDPIPVISLADKKTLSDGKYGFYKKITFDKTVEVYLELIGTHEKECKHVRYGIYEDSKLEMPIEEHFFIDWGDESYLEGELNIWKPVPENEDGEVTLEPGTYYLGLFTTDPRDDFEVEIEGYYKTAD